MLKPMSSFSYKALATGGNAHQSVSTPEDYKRLFFGLVEQSVAGVYLIQDSVLIYVNQTFAHMCGTTRDRLIGRELHEVAPVAQRQELQVQYERRLRGESPEARFTVQVTPRDGRARHIEIHGTRIDFGGKPAVVGVGTDITEREQQHQELLQSAAMMAELVSHIDNVREEERTRIAMELHDAIGGMLTALKFDISRISKRLQLLDPHEADIHQQRMELQHVANQALELTQETITSVRQISEDLSPSALQHLGIVAALSDDLAIFQSRYGVQCQLNKTGDAHSVSEQHTVDVYRIFQEALTNISKHAHASTVVVSLTLNNDAFSLEIQDDGVGYDSSITKAGAYGILSMKERARKIGGRLYITSNPEQGTSLRLSVPA